MMLSLQAQNYFSRLFTFDDIAPNPTEMIAISEDSFIVNTLTIVNGLRSSTILAYNALTDNLVRYDKVGIEPNDKSLLNIDNQFLLYGTNKNVEEDSLVLVTMNSEFETIDLKNYSTPGEFKFHNSALVFENKLFATSTYETDVNVQITNIKQLDFNGNVQWSKSYFEDVRLKGDYDYTISLDGNILNSSSIKFDIFDRFTQVSKLDTSGNLIWRYDHDEESTPATNVNVVQLSNGNIVMSYSVDAEQFDDIKFVWLDSGGIYLKEQRLESPGIDELYFENFVEGKGDYFFAHGKYDVHEPDSTYSIRYGLLTKYSNEGDTIWTRRYRHPEHTTQSDEYKIIDVVEEENGDIVCLAGIFRWLDPIRPIKAWLFRVDENGCHPDFECEEYINFSSTKETYMFEELKLYPNPTSDIIYVELPEGISGNIEIFNALGQRMKKFKAPENKKLVEVDVSHFPSGTFYAKFYNPDEPIIFRTSFIIVD